MAVRTRVTGLLLFFLIAAAMPVAAQPATIKILPLGDSITYGTTTPLAGGYRSPLWRALERDRRSFDAVGSLQDPATYRDPDHSGHRSWLIADLTYFLPDTLPTRDPFRPTYTLLMIGTNDTIANRDVANAGSRLSTLIDRIFSLVPETTVLVASIPPGIRTPDFGARVVDYNQKVIATVADQAARGRRVRFVDVNSALTAADIGDDGIHPNAQGY